MLHISITLMFLYKSTFAIKSGTEL